jgi:hypothetical protein
MPIDHHHPVPHQGIGRTHRLLRVAGIIHRDFLNFLAEHTARGVNIRNGEIGSNLHLRAKGGIGAGKRASRPDFNLCLGRARGEPQAESRNSGSAEKNVSQFFLL